MSTNDKLEKAGKQEMYAEVEAREVPMPEVTGPALENGVWVYRFEWGGIFSVEGRDVDEKRAHRLGYYAYKATYLWLVPQCVDNAPWGLA